MVISVVCVLWVLDVIDFVVVVFVSSSECCMLVVSVLM